ncbi:MULTISPECIES: hypothetical protein [unclassified Streptomyces]|uniref:aromatic-ring hydroxylase C-terminal domain-containing protein n=1 Tax=unclassified Streptomyces TaxID=2593676 RepID=UPI001BE52D4D|nr:MULTISPECIES: hypothetical protein [unclassified Streptomyces]MBT2406152.1 hypothetical protein [Streptomyces sp. ISL-21]MBT2609210.1 hypothetical protein [Streptomyces sp. ISL-87]
MLRQAQLLVGYRGSPVVGRPEPSDASGPQPGDRAPDCGGLGGDIAAYPLRLYDLLRDRGHVLLLYGDDPAAGDFAGLAAAARELSQDRVEACLLLAEGAPDDGTPLPVYRDGRGEFARIYEARGGTAFLIRPDGYLSARLPLPAGRELAAQLAAVFQN